MDPFAVLPDLSPFQQALLTACGWVLAAVVADWFVRRVLRRVVGRTRTLLDDDVLELLRGPIAVSVLLGGVQPTLTRLLPDASWVHNTESVLLSIAILVWTLGLYRISWVVLQHGVDNEGRFDLVNTRTQPLFDLTLKAFILGASAYWLMVAWDIDPTGWLASAGILGIAVGFAAQESLGNLFAGIFIVTDAPYKLDDYLVLPDGTRGRVTDIGLRSTRMLTNDGVEVTLPNREMAAVRITNESGGPSERSRVRVVVEVAYGTDLEAARAVMLGAAAEVDHILPAASDAPPICRFRAFQGSGIEAEVVGWVPLPEQREWALDALLVAVYDALNAADIEIPYSTHVVQLQTPLASPGGGAANDG